MRGDMDAPSQAERANRLTFLLELGKAELAFPFALLLQFHAPKEVLVGPVQVSECLLRGAFRELIHPGNIRLLQAVEFSVKIKSGGTFASRTIGFLGPSQAPVVGKPGCTSMPETSCSLLV